MDIQAVQKSYARWAPVYDKTFGAITGIGRRRAVKYINTQGPSILEVGVGTGLSLEDYTSDKEVVGIDASAEMLGKARVKVDEKGLTHVKALEEMDARALKFPDNHFDTVAAMHIVSVVPEPERVVAEMARVCKPGGKVVITNHFARDTGVLSLAERITAPFANLIGWHSDFRIETVLQEPSLKLTDKRTLPPVGMMTLLIFEKEA
ncbi:class I SAM-dependent methyltransferase [Litoreibacter roseus]|uniref:SAM-dependent methyltransferase n=1 Tax=Litoreibacter roseus TaxID=2601869 RepID=A0A6N6JCS5_9RHOB|nr:methyltransferase domain-containing protein [Litoreibacter roseus]GFE63630.1 SAM-dependent methyltransferase [Litoreibacter roseus]